MAVKKLELLGLKCPQPILKIAGDILEVLADCESFPRDIEAWCKKTGKTLLFCRDEGGKFNAQVQF
jgi:tRNA 2-thiouridine synthesizing protein A